jgi:hypothetical protein
MMTFDVPGPFGPKGRRNVSNVPAQALVLMNDPFVVEQARLWAGALVAQEESEEKRIDKMFLTALGRKPGAAERGRVESYLAEESAADPVDTWANLAHVVINMKEFIFIP